MKGFYLLLLITELSLSWVSPLKAQTNLVVSTPLSNTPGSYNTYLGWQVAYNIPGGYFLNGAGEKNTYVGYQVGSNNTTGSYNTYSGYNTGYGNTTGSYNVFIGYAAGINNRSGEQNTYLGVQAGLLNWYGVGNVAIGSRANRGPDSGSLRYSYNVVIGDSAGLNNGVSGSVFVGSKAGFTNKTGQLNTYLGYQSGYNAVADSNTFVGYKSGYSVTSGKSNTFFGSLSGQGVSTGNRNTIVGNGAGPTSGTVDENVYIGYTTGNHDSGSRNTFLGTGADALAQNLTNATAIGAGAEVAVSDAVVLGKEANIGIGTSAPTARLHVRSERMNESGIRLENLTSNSPATVTTQKVLTVNERGEIVLARPSAGRLFVESQTAWADRVFEPDYSLKPLHKVEQFVKANRHLPDMPSVTEVVKNGYEAAVMDARLLQKVEETMLYVMQLKREVSQLQQENKQLKRAMQRMKKQ